MGYMTASQSTKKWNVSQRRVQMLCIRDRIKSVFKLGDNRAIPDDARMPKDNRKKEYKNNEG